MQFLLQFTLPGIAPATSSTAAVRELPPSGHTERGGE